MAPVPLIRYLLGLLPGVIFATVVSIALTGCTGDPTDEAMIRVFQEHRQEFESLRLMVVQDRGLDRVGEDFTRPADPATVGVSPERIAEYRRNFQRLGITRGFAAGGDHSDIDFIAHAEGLSISGHSKNYCWRTTRPDELVESIDGFRVKKSQEYQDYLDHKTKTFREHRNVYRPIEGDWHLSYDS